MAEGRAERERVPLEAHAVWEAPADRADPVGDPRGAERHARAGPRPDPPRADVVSPFTFYRGGAAIMAADLAADTDDRPARAVLRRRAPLELRGVRLAGAPARLRSQRLRRDAPGPFEWDVKRLVASFVVAARDNGFTGARTSARPRAPAAESYRATMADAPTMRFLDVWYARVEAEEMLAKLARARATSGAEAGREEPRQGARAHEPRVAGEVRREGRRRLPHPAGAAGDRAPAGVRGRGGRGDRPPGPARLRRDDGPGPARLCSTTTTSWTSHGRSSASDRSAPRRS